MLPSKNKYSFSTYFYDWISVDRFVAVLFFVSKYQGCRSWYWIKPNNIGFDYIMVYERK